MALELHQPPSDLFVPGLSNLTKNSRVEYWGSSCVSEEVPDVLCRYERWEESKSLEGIKVRTLPCDEIKGCVMQFGLLVLLIRGRRGLEIDLEKREEDVLGGRLWHVYALAIPVRK